MNTRIKICGLTQVEETEYVNNLHVDFVGMVLFFPKSKRNISIERAKEIMAKLDASIKPVAVVVSPTYEQAKEIASAGFSYIQIHGTLLPEILENLKIPIIKAFNITDLPSFSEYESHPNIIGFVFDSKEPGSGETFDWDLLKQIPPTNKMILLAGGLTSENVAAAISQVHPTGVDVSSAVEYTDKPGKDPAKIDAFVLAVRSVTS